MAVDSVGCEAGPAVAFEARVMVEGLRQIRESLRQIDEKIHEACSPFPEYECLLSIPGFGRDVSAKVLGAIGDPFRFQNGRQVLKMAGLDLSAKRSGKSSESVIPVISRKGKADLRYALYQAAFIASVRNPDFIVYYTDKLRGREREPGIKIKMRVKLAAKLLIIAWRLMKKKESFNPDYLEIEQETILIRRESPEAIVEADPGPRVAQLWASHLNFGIWIRDDGWPPAVGHIG